MARVLAGGEWYDEVSPGALYESEYEAAFLQEAPAIFPDLLTVPFTPVVSSEHSSARPDLALLDSRYRAWWVVEVEVIGHSLHSHVVPQVRTLAGAAYGEPEVTYLCEQDSRLDRRLLRTMVRAQQPQVLVVVNAYDPGWPDALGQYGAKVMVFEIYRSRRNRHVFRISGEPVAMPAELITPCSPDRSIPRLLKVHAPAALPVASGGLLTVRFDGAITQWNRIDSANAVWLNPASANPLSSGVQYDLVRSSDGDLELIARDRDQRRRYDRWI